VDRRKEYNQVPDNYYPIPRRSTGGLARHRDELDPPLSKWARQRLDAEAEDGIIRAARLHKGAYVADAGINLTAALSAEAAKQKQQTPLDAVRLQAFVDEFAKLALDEVRSMRRWK
jgi:hypothetical protein